MLHERTGLKVAILLALVALSGRALRPARASEAAAERKLTLPSGATLKVAGEWGVTESKDGLTLEDPEKQLKLELVEVESTSGWKAAITTAWSRRRPGFKREELASSDSPGREGWDLFHWSEYKTSPE